MKRKEIIRRLESYRKFAPEIEALARTVNEIRSGAVMPSKVIDGMPRAGTPQDMSGYAARIDKAERKLNSRITQAKKAREETIELIFKLEDPRGRAVLLDHYINGLTWEQTAESLHYSLAHIYNLKNKAIQDLTRVLNE